MSAASFTKPLAIFSRFTEVNDAAGATTKKLVKQQILAEYFRELNDADLPLAVRFASGRAFPATDERVLNVGGAIVSDTLLSILQIDPGDFSRRVVRGGEIGEAIRKIWPVTSAGELLLADLAKAFDALSATGNAARKREILRNLLIRSASGNEAAYITKIIFGDLRTGVQEGVLQAAVAQAFAQDLHRIQRAQLLIGDLEEVAQLARKNALESAQFRLFHPIQFMLATPQETADDAGATIAGRTFLAEDKLDGIRAQAHKSGDRLAIYTRTMDRADAAFSDVVEQLLKIPGDFLLDGEIVAVRDGVVLPFANIQKRLGRKAATKKILRDHPCAFIAFDLLYRDGRLLMDSPLEQRRAELEALAGLASSIASNGAANLLAITPMTAVSTAGEISAIFDAARGRRNEGIVLKDPQSPYSPGRRGKMWLKLKTHLPTLDCVVTAAEFGRGKRRDSLSDYTFGVWDRDPQAGDATLVNIGKAYIGVTDQEIAQLTEIFLEMSAGQTGRVRQAEPRIVLEIACDQIQKSDRHAGGFALRFPRIKRIRWDKKPADADRLERVAEIYQSSPNFARQEGGGTEETFVEPTLFDGM
jgi:DNA ligase-1